ncbi:MAG: hypothetical protein KGR16_06995 [Verrucomicrobia bacterium]|nr:hypothetical protein [Verrucomicrobiota bacterium]
MQTELFNIIENNVHNLMRLLPQDVLNALNNAASTNQALVRPSLPAAATQAPVPLQELLDWEQAITLTLRGYLQAQCTKILTIELHPLNLLSSTVRNTITTLSNDANAANLASLVEIATTIRTTCYNVCNAELVALTDSAEKLNVLFIPPILPPTATVRELLQTSQGQLDPIIRSAHTALPPTIQANVPLPTRKTSIAAYIQIEQSIIKHYANYVTTQYNHLPKQVRSQLQKPTQKQTIQKLQDTENKIYVALQQYVVHLIPTIIPLTLTPAETTTLAQLSGIPATPPPTLVDHCTALINEANATPSLARLFEIQTALDQFVRSRLPVWQRFL